MKLKQMSVMLLVIDDTFNNLRILSKILTAHTYEVCILNGQMGLMAVQSAPS